MHSTRLHISDALGACRQSPDDANFEKLENLLFRLYHYEQAALDGWEAFDWKRAHEAGWFSLSDYSAFPELASFKDDAMRRWYSVQNKG